MVHESVAHVRERRLARGALGDGLEQDPPGTAVGQVVDSLLDGLAQGEGDVAGFDIHVDQSRGSEGRRDEFRVRLGEHSGRTRSRVGQFGVAQERRTGNGEPLVGGEWSPRRQTNSPTGAKRRTDVW